MTTHSRQEELLGINTDHQNLCNVDAAGYEFAKLVDFLTTVLEEARLRIVNGSPQCTKFPLGQLALLTLDQTRQHPLLIIGQSLGLKNLL